MTGPPGLRFFTKLLLKLYEKTDSIIKSYETEQTINKGDNIESVIVNQFLPIIKQRFWGDSEADNVDYIKLVQWYLNNDLLQQALTIFTEKIPISIFEKKIVCYNGDVEKEKNVMLKIEAIHWCHMIGKRLYFTRK